MAILRHGYNTRRSYATGFGFSRELRNKSKELEGYKERLERIHIQGTGVSLDARVIVLHENGTDKQIHL